MNAISANYIESFNAIEKWLRAQLEDSNRYDMPSLIDTVADSNFAVRRHASKLKELNRFRNFIVHNYSSRQALAVPTQQAADIISVIRKELITPTALFTLSATPVITCQADDPITAAVRKMRDGSFSQIPVCSDQTFVGLLTAETVARWLSVDLTTNDGMIEEKFIAEVLGHQENPDNYTFLSKEATVDDGLAAFDNFLQQGKRLDAVIITENGLQTEKVLGIVTIHDIPKMNNSVM